MAFPLSPLQQCGSTLVTARQDGPSAKPMAVGHGRGSAVLLWASTFALSSLVMSGLSRKLFAESPGCKRPHDTLKIKAEESCLTEWDVMQEEHGRRRKECIPYVGRPYHVIWDSRQVPLSVIPWGAGEGHIFLCEQD